jgi:hypothetical protein
VERFPSFRPAITSPRIALPDETHPLGAGRESRTMLEHRFEHGSSKPARIPFVNMFE